MYNNVDEDEDYIYYDDENYDEIEKSFNNDVDNVIYSKNVSEIKYTELPTKVTNNDLINYNEYDLQDKNNNNEHNSQDEINNNHQDLEDKNNNNGQNLNLQDQINIKIKDKENCINKTNSNNNFDTSFLNKKKERIKKSGAHNKFSDDNLRRKCKHLILKTTLDYINKQILQKYNNNIGNGIFRKQLLTINQKQKADATVQFNKDFLDKSLKDIFSENISSRYTIFPFNHNEKVINELINDTDEIKSQYFKKLFNLTFTQCLEHFRKTKFFEELKGLNGLTFINHKYGNDREYLETLHYYIMNYEKITKNKRARNRKKKEKKDKI